MFSAAGSIPFVCRLGHDIITSLDAGKANSAVPDAEVLVFAVAQGRILLTHNRRHFLRLYQHRTADHAGIVLCTFDPDFCRQAQRIDAVVAAGPEMTNKLVRLMPAVRSHTSIGNEVRSSYGPEPDWPVTPDSKEFPSA